MYILYSFKNLILEKGSRFEHNFMVKIFCTKLFRKWVPLKTKNFVGKEYAFKKKGSLFSNSDCILTIPFSVHDPPQ